jgi:hypothetical protein
MKKIITCLSLSVFFFNVQAQKLSLNITSSAPDFNYQTISDYESVKTAENAIRLEIETQKKGYHVYFRADGPIKTSSGQVIPESKFGIRIHNTVPVFPLSATNDQQLIITDNKASSSASYYLDFIVSPLYYDYDPGSYTVNILFTLTQE